LTKPSGGNLGSELESMFTRLSNKRRAPVIMSEVQKQARLDDPFSAPTPAAEGASAFHYDDYGNDDAGGFNEDGGFNAEGHARFGMDDMNSGEIDEYDSFMTQNTQSFNAGTRKTLETLENQFTTQTVVNFGELATNSCKKSDAAKLFYDILLLSTKEKIKVKQDRPFGEITISAPTALAH
jgi:cohesin complex subunit SCC1